MLDHPRSGVRDRRLYLVAEAVRGCGAAGPRSRCAVLGGLGAYIYFVDSKRPAAGVDGEAESRRRRSSPSRPTRSRKIRVTYAGETTLLKKQDGGWKMLEPAPSTPIRPRRSASQAITNARGPPSSTRTPPTSRSSGWPSRDQRRVQGRGRRRRRVQAGQQDRDAERHLRGQGRREARVPGVVVPGNDASTRSRSICATRRS